MADDRPRWLLRRLRRTITRAPRRLVRSIFRPVRQALRPPGYKDVLERLDSVERNLRNSLWARHEDVSSDSDQRTLLRRSEFRVFSQNGEDGLLLFLFSTIGTSNRTFVEFGIGDPRSCNAANLVLSFGWSGLLMDYAPRSVEEAVRFYHDESLLDPARVKIASHRVSPENIDELLASEGIEGEIDLLSVDIDGNDYWVWEAIRGIQPRVVMVEYNASLDPSEPLVTVYDPDFDRHRHHPFGWYHSASLAAFEKLGRSKGYALVGCESTGVNAFFVRSDVAKGKLEPLSAEQAYYPATRRTRVASPAEQYASLRPLDYVRV